MNRRQTRTPKHVGRTAPALAVGLAALAVGAICVTGIRGEPSSSDRYGTRLPAPQDSAADYGNLFGGPTMLTENVPVAPRLAQLQPPALPQRFVRPSPSVAPRLAQQAPVNAVEPLTEPASPSAKEVEEVPFTGEAPQQADSPPCSDWNAPKYVGCPPAEQAQSYYYHSVLRSGVLPPVTMPNAPSACESFMPGPYPYRVDEPPCDPPCCELGPPHLAADRCASSATYANNEFSPDPFYDHLSYNACAEQNVYGGKHLNPNQRPLVELGMPLYDKGPVPSPFLWSGEKNPSVPKFYVFGDYRLGYAQIEQAGSDKGVLANRINLEADLALTATERIHAFSSPFQEGNDFMRFEFEDGEAIFFEELDFFNEGTDTLFFEGDLGYMIGGMTGIYAPFDIPVTAGLIPLLFQNGIWMQDAIVGAAITIPARNSPRFDWSNFDTTFFVGFDQVTSPAFDNNNSAAHVFGATTFIEARGGYFEIGYAFLDDEDQLGRSYHNIGLSYTRRYLNLLSNSVRFIANTGQNLPKDEQTADGFLFLVENSFLTANPYNVIPYANFFVGVDRPQSVARAGGAGGILNNTGILFETDALTGFPTLDPTANDTWGAAFGLDLLPRDFSHQLILETAFLQAFGDDVDRNAPGNQYGVGARYQIPITNASLIRFDVMQGWFDNADDSAGARVEYRWKF